jgi:sugar lactone lactonase YvrE
MKIVLPLSLAFAAAAGLAGYARGHDHAGEPVDFSTIVTTPLAIEGLTADGAGNLYTTGRAGVNGAPCTVWRIDPDATPATLVVVGFLPAPTATTQCSPSGLAFDSHGALYFADGDRIPTLVPDAVSPPTATIFASGVPGTNGLTFDRDGNLWTGDGTTGQGRVWKISPAGIATEMFRVQPMRNGTALGGTLAGDGVGRQARDFPPGTSANSLGGQDLVANGVEFDERGDLLVADTARGAIWRVSFDDEGHVKNRTGCDTTFTANTLCLDSIWVAHPWLEGIDGFALDRAGNVWADANERNALVFVSHRGVVEAFRNPLVAATSLRNAGPLEFPTSPVLFGHRLCTTNSDGNRRDNSPNAAGEIGGSGQPRGKISCMNQRVAIPGLPLPIGSR